MIVKKVGVGVEGGGRKLMEIKASKDNRQGESICTILEQKFSC